MDYISLKFQLDMIIILSYSQHYGYFILYVSATLIFKVRYLGHPGRCRDDTMKLLVQGLSARLCTAGCKLRSIHRFVLTPKVENNNLVRMDGLSILM